MGFDFLRQPQERKEPSDMLMGMFVGYAVPTRPGSCRVFTRCTTPHPVLLTVVRAAIFTLIVYRLFDSTDARSIV